RPRRAWRRPYGARPRGATALRLFPAAGVVYVRPVTMRTADEIGTLTVIGAGTMGAGIAHVAALAGCTVQLFDAMAGAAAAGVGRIGKTLAKGVELGKLTAEARDAAIGRIRACDELAAACAGTDCAIEAVPEVLALKREIFAAVDRAAPEHALLT